MVGVGQVSNTQGNKYTSQQGSPHLVPNYPCPACQKNNDGFALLVTVASVLSTGHIITCRQHTGILSIVRNVAAIVAHGQCSSTSIDIHEMPTGPWTIATRIITIIRSVTYNSIFPVRQRYPIGTPKVVVGKDHKSRKQGHHKCQETDELEQPPWRAMKQQTQQPRRVLHDEIDVISQGKVPMDAMFPPLVSSLAKVCAKT